MGMALPILAGVGAAAGLAGTIFGIVSANDQAAAQKAQFKDAAATERAAGAQAELQQRRQLQRVVAAQDALRAGRGVSLTSGTALSLYEDTLKIGGEDIAAARLNTMGQLQRYRYASSQASQRASDATVGGALTGVGQLGSGVSSTYDAYKSYRA